MDAIELLRQLDHPPPVGFPTRMTVRFDVVQSAGLELE